MPTPEEIADETAGQIVDLDPALPEARQMILAAIERALASVPVPGGLSEERLKEIAAQAAEGRVRSAHPTMAAMAPLNARETIGLLHEQVRELLAERARLVRALHDCGQDGSAQVWAKGYEAGKAAGRVEGFREGASAQHRADAQYANEEAASFIEGEAGHAAAADVAYAVHEAPLVEPE